MAYQVYHTHQIAHHYVANVSGWCLECGLLRFGENACLDIWPSVIPAEKKTGTNYCRESGSKIPVKIARKIHAFSYMSRRVSFAKKTATELLPWFSQHNVLAWFLQ